MTLENELKKWVKSLTPSEKRFISLFGRARAGSGSQLLELFDWLNKAEEEESIPLYASFRANLPTLAIRLRELILDSLRLLGKETDINASLRTAIDEIAIMQHKEHWLAAARHIRKTKKKAYETSRYAFVLQCIEAEQVQLQLLSPDQAAIVLAELREEEKQVISRQEVLRELRYRHDALLALAKQFLFSREPGIPGKAAELADAPLVHDQLNARGYLENALAVDTLGILDLILRRPEAAIGRYEKLIEAWKAKDEWQSDQPELLMQIFKNYQNVCFYSAVDPCKMNASLHAMKGFRGLRAEKLRAFHETMFHHQFILSLNSGDLESALAMIPAIEEWMTAEAGHLADTHVLPFLCNFMVAEFLSENFTAANKMLIRILGLPNKKARVDIREFALLLQPVVQYEMGNTGLNEYLMRSGKRHFGKNEEERRFDLVVLKHIGLLMDAGQAQQKKAVFAQFINELESFQASHQGLVPQFGFNEIYMWALSRKSNRAIREIFLDEIRKANDRLPPED